MSAAKVDTGILKKASLFSYVMGIWGLLSVVVFIIAVVIMLLPMMSLMTPGYVPSLDTIYQIRDSILLSITLVAAITVPITLLFGYYSYKVGQLHDVGSLKLCGISSIIMTLGLPILLVGLYQFLSALGSMIPSPPPNPSQALLGSLQLLLAGGGIVGFFGLIFFISFIVAASGMKTRTGISDFSTAMWLSIIGLLIAFLFPIALIVFGSGLSKLAKPAEAATRAEPSRAPVRRETVYCPYCGAKVESDVLFCQSCGSSLKKEE